MLRSAKIRQARLDQALHWHGRRRHAPTTSGAPVVAPTASIAAFEEPAQQMRAAHDRRDHQEQQVKRKKQIH